MSHWIARESRDGWEVVDSNGNAIARFTDVQIYESCSILDGLDEDDAKLIAAAPQLLKVCQLLLAHYPKLPAMGEGVDIAQLAESAVASAKGR